MTTRIYSSRDIILFLSNITKVIYIRSHVCNTSILFSQREVGGEDGAKMGKLEEKCISLFTCSIDQRPI